MSDVLSVPVLLPGLLVSVLAAAAFGRRTGQALGASPLAGALIIVGVGLALSATLTPSIDALRQGVRGSGTCDLSRIGLASSNQLAKAGEVALNVIMLVPLGVGIGLLPRRRITLAVLGGAIALPFAIEGAQLFITSLGRECQSSDVVDNLTGLALGVLATDAIGLARTALRDRSMAAVSAGIAAALVVVLVLAMLLVPSSTPVPSPIVGGEPAPTAMVTGALVRVDSITELLDELANDEVGEIVVASGTYHVSRAATQAADSLWIGSRFASRTRAVVVRAETPGGVTFDGGGLDHFGGVSFEEGAHDQTWEGFVFADGTPTETGVVTFGGYAGLAAPHDITLRDITLARSLTTTSTGATDGGVYFSEAVGGPHDIVIDGLTVDGGGGLDFAVQFYHSSAGNPNAWNVTIRRLSVTGTQQAIIIWDPTLHDITIDTARIVDATDRAVRYESPGATRIVLANIISTGSGFGNGFESSLGSHPPGVTFVNDSLR